jgi:curli biogenesis system outer membrane secretion channel CsgG
MKSIYITVLAVLLAQISMAQKKVNTSFESIKEQCKDLPGDKRIRLTVARFSVTTSNAPAEFGDNMATMLANALQGVNCYTVLESLKNEDDFRKEVDHAESGYSKRSSSPKKGKQLGAQVVVTGELTEYSSKNNGMRFGLVKVGSNKAKVGFILKLINPETRVVLYSHSINTEGKTGSTTEFGAFGLNLVSTGGNDPALANACEQGIIKAVEFLASKKDSLNLKAAVTNENIETSVNETEVILTEANYTSFNNFYTVLTTIPSFKSAERSLKSGTASYLVTHLNTADNLLEELIKKMGARYEVIGFEDSKIEIKAKTQ